MALIEFQNADLGYRGKLILRDISCSVKQGESVGIVGPNGCGKTTLLRSVLGALKPSKGSIQVDRSHRFAYVPQVENLNLFLPLTVKETVYLPAKSRNSFGLISSEDEHHAEIAMQKTGIAEIAGSLLREVSGGQRQKTILAQAISQNPSVLLLDEPTRGLDVVAERDLLTLIRELKSERNLTLLFVTHTLQIVLNYMDKIWLFDDGKVIETTPDELIKTKKLEDIYGVPFYHHEQDGLRWVSPLSKKP